MFSSGGRRIKRSFYIDQSSISFCYRTVSAGAKKNTGHLKKSIEAMLEGKRRRDR